MDDRMKMITGIGKAQGHIMSEIVLMEKLEEKVRKVAAMEDGVLREREFELLIFELRIQKNLAKRALAEIDEPQADIPLERPVFPSLGSEILRLEKFGCVVRVEDGVLCAAPLNKDGSIAHDEWSEVEDTSDAPGLLDAVNAALGTSFVQEGWTVRQRGNK